MASSQIIDENDSEHEDSFANYSDHIISLLLADDSESESTYNENNESTETDLSCSASLLFLDADSMDNNSLRLGIDGESFSTEVGSELSWSNASFNVSNHSFAAEALCARKLKRDGKKHPAQVRFGQVQVRRFALVSPAPSFQGSSLFEPTKEQDHDEEEQDKYFDIKTFEKAKSLRPQKQVVIVRKRRPRIDVVPQAPSRR